jgi:FkbM family methyltransferase
MDCNNIIYIDVGVNQGITLQTASNFNFKHLYGFEPLIYYFKNNIYYKKFNNNNKITIIDAGLSDENKIDTFYISNNNIKDGSSQFPRNKCNETINIRYLNIIDFLDKNVDNNDKLVLKINCEGGEVPILEKLYNSKYFKNILSIEISWDYKKINDKELIKRGEIIKEKFKYLTVRKGEYRYIFKTNNMKKEEIRYNDIKYWLKNLFDNL